MLVKVKLWWLDVFEFEFLNDDSLLFWILLRLWVGGGGGVRKGVLCEDMWVFCFLYWWIYDVILWIVVDLVGGVVCVVVVGNWGGKIWVLCVEMGLIFFFELFEFVDSVWVWWFWL